MKRVIKIVIFLVAVVLIVAAARKLVMKRRADLRKERAVAEYPLPVEVARVRKGTFEETARYLGKVTSRNVMVLKARISGQVVKRPFLEGDAVKKGALLIALGRKKNGTIRELKAQIAVLKAKIASLEIQKKNLAGIYKRDTLLYKNGAISEEAWQLSQNKLAVVEGQINALKQEMAQVGTKLSYTKILSPFDGVVSQVFVSEGDVVFPGQPVCKVIKTGSYKVKVEVTPEDLRRISVGTPVYVGKTPLMVSRIYPAASSRALGVFEADFPPGKCSHRLGEIVPVAIRFGQLRDAWIAPIDAVLHGQDSALVFRVAGGKVYPVKVRILAESGENAALASGELREGMPLVCAHESRLMTLRPRQPVKIVGTYAGRASK